VKTIICLTFFLTLTLTVSSTLAATCKSNLDCDDNNPCTVDSCNKSFGICNHTTATDVDDDGHDAIACGGDDCDDNRGSVHPYQVEVCNGIDDNCEAGIDEGLSITGYIDMDGGGFGGNAAGPTTICPGAANYSTVNTDCDDDDSAVYPGTMRCTTTGGDIEICGKLGTWQTATPCPGLSTCMPQPNGTGLCLPMPQSADINGDGKIGIAEAINALGIASGQQ